ncbi:hypothetical protein L195_g048999, partial [Trifolium pratense]
MPEPQHTRIGGLKSTNYFKAFEASPRRNSRANVDVRPLETVSEDDSLFTHQEHEDEILELNTVFIHPEYEDEIHENTGYFDKFDIDTTMRERYGKQENSR